MAECSVHLTQVPRKYWLCDKEILWYTYLMKGRVGKHIYIYRLKYTPEVWEPCEETQNSLYWEKEPSHLSENELQDSVGTSAMD